MARDFISVRWVVGLTTPGAWALLAAWGLLQWEEARALAAPYDRFFCFGALGAAALLGWYYNRGRVFFVAVAAALTVWGADELAAAGDLPRLAAVFLLPLNFALLAWLQERGILSPRGLAKAAFVAAQVIAVVGLGAAKAEWLESFLRGGRESAAGSLPLAQQAAFAVAAITLLALVFRRRTKLEAGLLWGLVAMFLALRQTAGSEALYFYAGAGGVILFYAVLEHGAEAAYRDELTGLPGRRSLNEVLPQLGGSYAIAMCDVDHFKNFNDTYGHEAGDQVLRMVAAKLSQVPGGGRAFRYGGEEFTLVFADRAAKEALPLAESVRAAIATSEFVLRSPDRPKEKPQEKPQPGPKKTVTITISIGVAGPGKDRPTPEQVLDAADEALYFAKESGRNCVKLA